MMDLAPRFALILSENRCKPECLLFFLIGITIDPNFYKELMGRQSHHRSSVSIMCERLALPEFQGGNADLLGRYSYGDAFAG